MYEEQIMSSNLIHNFVNMVLIFLDINFRCEFIQMGYFVHAVARTHSFYDDIVVKLPIIIEPMVSHKYCLVD